MERAPFFDNEAMAPGGAESAWLRGKDGVRIRVASWATGSRGTVLLFPGRTEYIEKYGPAAGELATRGYATAIVDWRGQGLADRLLDRREAGHVGRFLDYQIDVAAMLAHVRDRKLPAPYFLIAHSMGGCIGLRALHDGLDVRAAAFSAPMWGIQMAPLLRPVAWIVGAAARAVGQDHRLTPGTSPQTYVMTAPFEDNVLTTDPEMYRFMQRQVTAHPELAIGGPTIRWLNEAMLETCRLARMPPPDYPCLTELGQRERVVNVPAIHRQMGRWPGSQLELVAGAEHEVIMEKPAIRTGFFDAAASFFDAHRA